MAVERKMWALRVWSFGKCDVIVVDGPPHCSRPLLVPPFLELTFVFTKSVFEVSLIETDLILQQPGSSVLSVNAHLMSK